MSHKLIHLTYTLKTFVSPYVSIHGSYKVSNMDRFLTHREYALITERQYEIYTVCLDMLAVQSTVGLYKPVNCKFVHLSITLVDCLKMYHHPIKTSCRCSISSLYTGNG